MTQLLSIIVPLYNEEENIKTTYEQVTVALYNKGFEIEIIFVDDGSSDGSLLLLKKLQSHDQHVKIISLSRNFGHQVAVSAGFDYAQGDIVAVIDADLQDPPLVILEFIKKWKEGYHVVYGIRQNRKEGIIKRFSYALFYRIMQLVSNISVPLDAGDFCLLDKKVVQILRQMPERNKFIRGLRSWVGFYQIGVSYERAGRFRGRPKYSFRKLLELALDGIISFSIFPLRLASWFGFIISALSFLGIALVLYLRFFTTLTVPGFSTIVITLLFLGGIQLISLGIIGEYLGRIYDEVKARPMYLIQEKLGFHHHES